MGFKVKEIKEELIIPHLNITVNDDVIHNYCGCEDGKLLCSCDDC